jgi:hypothetical protein
MKLPTICHPKSTPGGTACSIQNKKSQRRRDYLVSSVGEGSLIRSFEQLRTISRNLIRSSVAMTVKKGKLGRLSGGLGEQKRVKPLFPVKPG